MGMNTHTADTTRELLEPRMRDAEEVLMPVPADGAIWRLPPTALTPVGEGRVSTKVDPSVTPN